MIVLLDDHLLRDWLVEPDRSLRLAVGDATLATTNLWYARLCKSAARAASGALLGAWPEDERNALVASLVALPPSITTTPLRDLAWPMAVLSAHHKGLSTLGAEAVAAARHLDATLLVSARDDGPGIRSCCELEGVTYRTLAR